MSTFRYARLAPVLILTVALGTASAQTHITAPPNKYKPADDVKLGQEAAAQVQKRVADAQRWVGRRVNRRHRSASGPRHSLRNTSMRSSATPSDVVNQKEINAFALPGGPMFLNRGMIEAAQDEGEVAGVMAHELSHVAAAHGTAQATKGQKFQIGAIAGQVARRDRRRHRRVSIIAQWIATSASAPTS